MIKFYGSCLYLISRQGTRDMRESIRNMVVVLNYRQSQRDEREFSTIHNSKTILIN